MSEPESPEEAVEPVDAPPPLELPTDTAGWRTLIATIPARELLKAVRISGMSRFLLAGFRPGVDAVRNPVVVGRIVEAAQREPRLGTLLALEAGSADGAAAQSAAEDVTVPAPKVPDGTVPSAGDDSRLKEKVKELRTAVREKDRQLATLEERLSAALRERDSAQADIEAALRTRRDLESALERERRRNERAERRATTRPLAPSAPPPPVTHTPVTVPVPVADSTVPMAFEDALRRLLNRGKYSVVADLSREILVAKELPAATRGTVHALFAAALYGQSQDAAGEEQDRLAASACLDAGQIAAAAEAFTRLLSHTSPTSPPLRPAEMTLLQRLLGLASKTGQTGAVQTVFSRLRVGSPTGYQRLRRALEGSGRKHGELLNALVAPGTGTRVGPDENISLPTVSRTAATVTPRWLTRAVDSGDENFITCARDGIDTLRASNAPLADALLEAVAALHPTAVLPLTNPLPRPVVVDASNVARFNPDAMAAYVKSSEVPPAVGNLLAMRDFLLRRGFFPVLLIADANLRFHVDDRQAYLELIEKGIVRETPAGSAADGTLIAEARERVAPLVTNDRLAEWGDVARRIERLSFDIYPGGAINLTPL
jgi:hypothetical protein